MSVPTISAHWDYARSDDHLAALLAELVEQSGYAHSWRGYWTTEGTAQGSPEGWTPVASSASGPRHRELLLATDGAVVRLGLGAKSVSAMIHAVSPERLDELVRAVRSRFAETVTGADQISATFWYQTPNGPRSYVRVLAAPSFDEIASNYTEDVRTEMARILGPAFVPGRGGQLLLWHGPPGTGKTYMLRALLKGWRGWCSASYVTDVDRFFHDGSYTTQVLLNTPDEGSPPSTDEDDPARVASTDAGRRWHLVVLEDAGEFLSADAATRARQGFGRLLNATDGLLGQGLRVLLLLTTNEDIGKLHPAVARPGRCASRVEFGPLDAAAASRWLREHGVAEDDVDGPRTLAELYAAADGRRGATARSRPRLGFGAP